MVEWLLDYTDDQGGRSGRDNLTFSVTVKTSKQQLQDTTDCVSRCVVLFPPDRPGSGPWGSSVSGIHLGLVAMSSTKVTYVTGTAEVRRRDPSHAQNVTISQPEQHFVTEPSTPLEVSYVDGKCTCCPYGYHVDLDFLKFCSDLESGSTLKNLKKIQRTKRNLRKSMEIMLNEQEGIRTDPTSAPPDLVKSAEAERLIHMVNYEQSATVNILRQIDTSVRTDMASFESRATWNSQARTEENRNPNSHDGPSYKNPPIVVLTRADSQSSLSSSSTISSEAALLHQAELVQQQQQSIYNSRSVTKVVEQPVLEMATAEMKHYSTTSSAQLADINVKVDQADRRQSTGRQVKQNFVTEVSATYRTPDSDSPREVADVNETSVLSLKEALAASLQRIKVLEDLVKTVPILQVRISVLKEEKRLLNLQLKARKSSTVPLTSSVGVGDDSFDFKEEQNEPLPSARTFGHSSSTTIATSTPRKDLLMKSSPTTLPKPVKTTSVAVGNHSVLEPYNLQPQLPTGYTIRENETVFGIYSKKVFEKESLTISKSQNELLKLSGQHKTVHNIPRKDKNTSDIIQTASESNQSNITVNPTQKSSSVVVTRTVGVGDANVFEDSNMHVHEKELRTVIFGQNNVVAKRNVGIDCRVATRDVGVLFICDEEKPATRTIGVNVSYDTSGICTSLDFKGERELRIALQGVLHRSVRSIGTTCRMTEATAEHATMTDVSVGVSVGCGEEQRVDVEIRPAVVRKSVATTCKPDVGHKYVSTDADWILDASTNTYQVDSFDKGLMTDKVRQSFASTNTGPVYTHAASLQTDQDVFLSLGQVRHTASNTENVTGQVRHTASNTENVTSHSTGVSTDIITTRNVFVNTSENVSKIFKEAFKKERVDHVVNEESLQTKIETNRRTLDNERIEDAEKLRENKDTNSSADSRISDAEIQGGVIHERSDRESSFQGKSEYTKKSSRYDYGDTHYSSLEISSRSAPGSQGSISSKKIITSGQEDLNNNASILENVDGKKLIPEEKITTSSAGTNRSFTQYAQSDDGTMEADIDSGQRPNNQSINMDDSQTGIWNNTKSYSYSSDNSSDFSSTGNSHISGVSNQNQAADKLAKILQSSDSHTLTKNSLSSSESQKNEQAFFYQESMQKISPKPDTSSEIIYKMRRAGSVEDFMPNDIRKYMSLNPAVSEDNGLGRDLTNISSSNFRTATTSSEAAVTSDENQRKAFRTVTVKRISKSGGLSALPEISTFQDQEFQSDSENQKKEVVEEAFVKSVASICGEQSEASGQVESNLSSSATTAADMSRFLEDKGQMSSNVFSSATTVTEMSRFLDDSGQMSSNVSSSITTTTDMPRFLEDRDQVSSNVSSSAATATEMSRFLEEECQMSSSLFSQAKDEISFDSATVTSTVSSMGTVEMMVGESQELAESIPTSESFRRKPVLKSIMKHSTETQCANTRKAITFAESVTGGTGSSSEEDNNSSDADSADSFDEGSYNGQEVTVTYYSKEEGAPGQDTPGVQVLDQNIRQIYELSDEVRNACSVVGTYLIDSTSIQTKQLNASQEIIQQEWFQLSSHKLSSAHKVEDFLSSVNEISSRLLEYIINMADANGNTAIHYCISHCNLDIASLLLDSRVCDTNRRNKAGYTPIMLAGLATLQDQQQYDVIRRLLSLGDVNARATQTQQTALMLAASHGRKEMVKLLIEEGADVNLQDEDGSTALMCACEHGYIDVVNILLTHPGIDVNLTDCENSTAISIAMEAGHKDIGVVLYKHLNFSKVSSPGSHKKEKKFQLFHSK